MIATLERPTEPPSQQPTPSDELIEEVRQSVDEFAKRIAAQIRVEVDSTTQDRLLATFFAMKSAAVRIGRACHE